MNRLLNESWIEGLPDNIVENLEALNRYVVQRICERIKEIGDIGASDSLRLKSAIEYAGADLDAIEREISRIMKMNRAEVQRLFEEVAAENIDFANTYYAARGMEELRTYRSRANLTAFVESAKRTAMDGTANLSHTYMIGFKRGGRVVPLREYYITAVDRAVTLVQTGTVDYQTAMRSIVQEMAQSGLRRVTFDSGYSRRLDSQARMNILEGVRRLNADMMEETGKEFGADGVEISVHGLCAPDHQPIQGRQFSNREYERLNERLQRPIGTLNCHHFPTPIILGVSKPVHSARELEEINARSNAPVEYRGHTMTRYEASQKQRQLETAIRYAKDERDACVAAGDKIGAAQARKRSAALGREYKSFCEQAGLTPRPERTRSMTGPTVENNNLTNKKMRKNTADGAKVSAERSIANMLGVPESNIRISNLPKESQISIQKQIEKVIDYFPQIKGHLKQITYDDTISAVASSSSLVGTIKVSEKFMDYAKMAEAYSRGEKYGFYAKGTSVDSIIVHEAGHQIDGLLTKKKLFGGEIAQYGTIRSSREIQKEILEKIGLSDQRLREIRQEWKERGYSGRELTDAVLWERKEFISSHVSEYVATNEREFLAECFSELITSENPREAALALGEILQRAKEMLK